MTRLTRRVVYEFIRRGELPATKIGRNIRVPHRCLQVWLEGRAEMEAASRRAGVITEDDTEPGADA